MIFSPLYVVSKPFKWLGQKDTDKPEMQWKQSIRYLGQDNLEMRKEGYGWKFEYGVPRCHLRDGGVRYSVTCRSYDGY